jgi:5-methylcytosine-specific restriction protein A
MTTYLLTWNPKRFAWDDLEKDILQVRMFNSQKGSWSCGNTRRIQPGDRFFLMRLGQKPRGIIASGIIISKPIAKSHWDDNKAAQGLTSLFVDVLLETICDASFKLILAQEALCSDPLLSTMHWSPQASGIRMPDDVAAELERRWFALLSNAELTLPDEVMLTESFREGSVREALVKTYERNPAARHRCIEYYGAQCVVCGFNFEAVYGPIGAGYIHVHHEVPLSEIGKEYEVDPIQDMKPVCPNCHAMIHRKRPAYSITELCEIVIQRQV